MFKTTLFKSLYVLTGVGALLLTACQPSATPTPTPVPSTPTTAPAITDQPDALRMHPLIGKIWGLAGYTAPDGTAFEPLGQLQLVFNADNSFGISGGCNLIGGNWQLGEAQALTFTLGPSTMMACEEGLMRQEQDINQLLATVTHYTLTADTLELNTATQAAAIRLAVRTAALDQQALAALLSNHWQIVAQLIGGDALQTFSEPYATLQFEADGKLNGFASCNQFFGSYDTSSGQLKLTIGGVTRMSCPEAVMNQEQAVLAALEQVIGLEIGEAGIHLLTTGEGRLYLELAPPPTN